MKTLRFTKGMAAAPRCPHHPPDWAIERRWGTAKADSKSLVGFPAEVCELE
jgi:hypothetical protein